MNMHCQFINIGKRLVNANRNIKHSVKLMCFNAIVQSRITGTEFGVAWDSAYDISAYLSV